MADIDKLNIDSIIQRLLEGEGGGGWAEGKWVASRARGGGSWEAGWACRAEGNEPASWPAGWGLLPEEGRPESALGPTRGLPRLHSFIALECSLLLGRGNLKTLLPTPTFPVVPPCTP